MLPLLQEHSNVSKPENKYEYEDKIIIVCDTGYTVQGNDELTCQANKTWNHPPPSCESKYLIWCIHTLNNVSLS